MTSSSSADAFAGHIGRTLADSKLWWPAARRPAEGTPNVLLVLFDDVGFSDFGCYGSTIPTPTIDGIAALGLRYTGFHTTAMCSTTRAALLTGRNHHDVGMGCLPTPVTEPAPAAPTTAGHYAAALIASMALSMPRRISSAPSWSRTIP